MTGDPDDRLLQAATRVADGAGVDWAAHAEGVDPGVLKRLQEIEALAGIFARDARNSGGDGAARQFGRLELRAVLRRDPAGTLYLAYDPVLERDVALRRFPAGLAATESVLRKARALARIENPGVLKVHGVIEQDGVIGVFAVPPDGPTLADGRAPVACAMSAQELLELARDLSTALVAIHDGGIAYGAIARENVVRAASGRWSLLGIAAVFAPGHGRAPHAGHTPPPGRRSQRDDVTALGRLLLGLATGREPEPESRLMVDDLRRYLAEARTDLPAELREAIARAAAADPQRGFAGARELADALSRESAGGLAARVLDALRRLTPTR